MRIAIALCFSAVLCTVYASVLPMNNVIYAVAANIEVKNAILSVERTIQNVDRVRADTKEDTIFTVTTRWWEQQDNYRNYVNLLLQSMRREVSNAKNYRGVDAQKCFDANLWAINSHTDTAYQAAKKCQESAEKSIETGLGFLDSLISLGEELIKQLNDVVLNCHNDDEIKMKSCILSEFSKISNDVKEYEEDAKRVEFSALPASNYVVLQATQCLTNAYLLARFESQSQMLACSRCVKEAIEKKNK